MSEKLKKCGYCTSPRKPWEITEDTGAQIIDCHGRKFYLQIYSPEIIVELQIDFCPKCGGLLQHSTRKTDKDLTDAVNELIKDLESSADACNDNGDLILVKHAIDIIREYLLPGEEEE